MDAYRTVTDILAGISTIVVFLRLGSIVNILPSLLSCMIRWKESVNLEDSVKLSRDRNTVAAILAIPFCLCADYFRMPGPDYPPRPEGIAGLGITFGFFAAFCIVRLAMSALIRPGRIPESVRKTARNMSRTFFCIAAIAVPATGGICSFAGMETDLARLVLNYETAAIFLVFLYRKYQIFRNYCSYFSAFLYLCALEILPAAIFAVPAMFL